MKTKSVPNEMEGGGGGGLVVQEGRVQKVKPTTISPSQKKVVENAEMKGYLNKLQELVPFMPKNKRLSKVEVISYAIDYIRELRLTLGLPPCEGEEDADPYQSMLMMASATSAADPSMSISKMANVNNEANQSSLTSHHPRQPLIDISSPSNTSHSSGPQNDDNFPVNQPPPQEVQVSKSIAAS